MPWIRLSDSELRRVRNYVFSYNAKGFVLMEFGPREVHHVRLDLEPTPQGKKYEFVAGARAGTGTTYYRVYEFHVKIAVEGAFLYKGFDYRGGGVWRPVWGKYEAGNYRRPLDEDQNARCLAEARTFLLALRDVTTDMDQMLSIDAPPEMLRGAEV